jgi:hypothetical protein
MRISTHRWRCRWNYTIQGPDNFVFVSAYRWSSEAAARAAGEADAASS